MLTFHHLHSDDDEGFVKYLADAKTDKVLGCHMIGAVLIYIYSHPVLT